MVPGANDNLSAVAVLVAVAEALREEPAEGLRVVLASCGAEEMLQGGIHGFAARHLDEDGSPAHVGPEPRHRRLARARLLEGEGEVVMEDFFDRGWRDLIARVADREGIPMRRGMRCAPAPTRSSPAG